MQVKGISPESEKKIAIFKFCKDGRIMIYTHEKGYTYMSKEQLKEIHHRPRDYEHLMLRNNEKDEDYKFLSMKKQLKAFDIEAEILKRITNDKINLYKTASVAKTALHLFYSFKPPKPEKIQQFEGDIFESCCTGGHRYAIPYVGKGWKYDICSNYPGIMKSVSMQFPIGEGKLTTISQQEVSEMKYFKYGIYHVKISGIDNRLLKENSKQWYTHIDVNRALELKYNVEIIEDGHPNALLYEGKLVNGSKLFGAFIDYLFTFKNQKFGCIKRYINVLWGSLSQTDKFTINTKVNNEIHEDKEVLTMCPVMDGDKMHYVIDVYKPANRYDNDYARIKPFMAAKGRYIISKIIEKNLNNLVYCHTDGIILKEEITGVKLGSDIGQLKFEEYAENCEVVNGQTTNGFTKNKDDIFTKLKQQQKLAKQLYPTI